MEETGNSILQQYQNDPSYYYIIRTKNTCVKGGSELNFIYSISPPEAHNSLSTISSCRYQAAHELSFCKMILNCRGLFFISPPSGLFPCEKITNTARKQLSLICYQIFCKEITDHPLCLLSPLKTGLLVLLSQRSWSKM